MADLPGRYEAFNSEVNRLKEVSKLCTENALAFANKKCTLPTKKQPAKHWVFPTSLPIIIFNSNIASFVEYEGVIFIEFILENLFCSKFG